MNLICTQHATNRMRQRALSPFIVDMLFEFGAEKRTYGATTYFFDKKSLKKMASYLGTAGIRDATKLRKAYAVVGDGGELITVGYRSN